MGMKQNKFKLIIPSYNNEKWVEPNIASIINQTYKNYEVLYINDASTDSTPKLVQKIIDDYNLSNWKLVNWKTNKQRGYNVNPNSQHVIDFMGGKDEDILMFVDGDDWLIDENVLENLNNFYNTHHCWMAYGGMYTYPSSKKAYPQNTEYSKYVHENKLYRKDLWRASHLRSFKWFLYKEIKKEDLIYSKTNEYYYNAEDLAVSFYCLEMCPPHKIGVLDFPSYVYNEDPDIVKRGLERQNNDINDPKGQEAEIRAKSPYPTLNRKDPIIRIKPTLSGGLGNMMFQIAAAYGLGSNLTSEIVTDFTHLGTAHNPPLAYKNNLFKKLIPLSLPLTNYEEIKSEPQDFSYEKELVLSGDKNVILTGYFQSYKYFDHCKNDIINFFSYLPYNKKMGYVSLHVRRGNYLNLSQYHYNLNIDYYKNAINYFKGYKFLIFSDDIEWCKQQFIGNEFEFVENKTDFESLHLMSECQHHIIANSTFSWWGAYLDPDNSKKVVYPDKWFGPHYENFTTKDLFPNEWICLSEDIPKIKINLFDNACRHLSKDNGRYSTVYNKISKHIIFERDLEVYNGITLFTDEYLTNGTAKNTSSDRKIGWLMETREVYPLRYEQFEDYMDDFEFILTHDKELLNKYPTRTKLVPFGGCWIKNNNFHVFNKTKNLSMIYSNKTLLTGHKLRHSVASQFSGIDLFGRGTSNPIDFKEESLVNYRFSIVIENSKADNYFTEKLLDCFAVGTIPIYWGCPNLGNYFNLDGVITFNNLKDLKNILPTLNKNLYDSKIEAIKENLKISKEYNVTEDWIYKNIINE